MMGLSFQIFQILAGFYLIFAYSFFLLPYLFYLLGDSPFQDKLVRTISFVLTPFFLPLIAIGWIGWSLLSVFGGMVVVFLFTWVSLLVWLNARFPFGKVFKTWFGSANWVLQKVERFLEWMGIKKWFFGIPLSNWKPMKQV